MGAVLARIVYILVAVLVASLLRPAAASDRCERALSPLTQSQILSDAADLFLAVDMPKILPDRVNPAMGLFEPLANPRTASEANELRTARDYATYLHERNGDKFVFAGTFRGAYVPVFDGLVFDQHGFALYNVSLKHATLKVRRMRGIGLLKTLSGRMDMNRQIFQTKSLMTWLNLVNGWQWQPQKDSLVLANYQRDLERGAILAYVFGLNLPAGLRFPCGRELHTVLDMRDSGYTYEFVSGREDLLYAIGQMVRSDNTGSFSLTLLWDARHVLEFGHRD